MAGIHPGRLGERVLRDRNQPGVPLLRAQPEGCWYAADNARPDEREPQKTVVVDRAYIDTHTPVVRDRLVKAGVRLGGLLNRALRY
jgi:hypothetical protein